MTISVVLFVQAVHVMSCHVMACHVMACHVMACHVMQLSKKEDIQLCCNTYVQRHGNTGTETDARRTDRKSG